MGEKEFMKTQYKKGGIIWLLNLLIVPEEKKEAMLKIMMLQLDITL